MNRVVAQEYQNVRNIKYREYAQEILAIRKDKVRRRFFGESRLKIS